MNGKYELIEAGRAILVTLLSLVVAISVALFMIINISPLLITRPGHLLGLSSHQLIVDYLQVIKYLQIPGITLQLHYLPITASAISHFGDVKLWILINEAVMIMAGPLLIQMLRKQKRQNQLWRLILPFQMMFILLIFTTFMGITDFNRSFIKFHYLLFNNMDWVFNPHTNPIILLMPERFFELLFCLWMLTVLVILLLIWGWLKWTLRTFLRQS